MTTVQEVTTFANEEGDESCEICIDGRRMVFFVERRTGRVGWAIASSPPDLVRDGSGYLERSVDLFGILMRGLQ